MVSALTPCRVDDLYKDEPIPLKKTAALLQLSSWLVAIAALNYSMCAKLAHPFALPFKHKEASVHWIID